VPARREGFLGIGDYAAEIGSLTVTRTFMTSFTGSLASRPWVAFRAVGRLVSTSMPVC
jgi:hypothetical protein